MPISLKRASGGGGIAVGQVIRLSDSLPTDYTDISGNRYLRGGNVETNTTLFDNTIWADSIGTLWRETYRDSTSTSNQITYASYVNNIFIVAFQNGGNGVRSTDGVNWVTSSFPSSNTKGIAYGAGLYVCLGSTSGSIFTSADLVTWTPRTSTTSEALQCVIFANGLFVVGGNDSILLTSPDGINWTSRTSTFSATQDVHGITYGAGLFVAVGGDSNTSSKIATSPDGVNWTNRTITGLITTPAIQSVAYNGSCFVAGMSDSFTGYYQTVYSTNGTTWSRVAADDFNYYLNVVEDSYINIYGWGGANIIAIGNKFYVGRMRSGDGLNWEYIATAKTVGTYAGDSSKIICAGKRVDRSTTAGATNPSRSIVLSVLSAGISESIPEGGTDQYVRIS